jgi:transketolase
VKATRDWFGSALVAAGQGHPRIVVVNCDLGNATKTLAFRDSFPSRFFEGGIAEANAIGVAAGLALEGYRPFVASFGHFLTGKFIEIFQSVGLNDAPVVLVGTHAGLAIGKDGPTQMGLRDLGLMRTLPNVAVMQPADGVETARMVEHLASTNEPAYLRLCRQPAPEVHDENYCFVPGRPDVVRDGRDVLVLTMGGSLHSVIGSLPVLAEEGLAPTVVNVSSLPVGREALHGLLARHDKVLVVEDHYRVGGLADEVARVSAETGATAAFRALTVTDYGQAAAPEDLYERYGLSTTAIATKVRDFAAA